METAPSHGTQ